MKLNVSLATVHGIIQILQQNRIKQIGTLVTFPMESYLYDYL